MNIRRLIGIAALTCLSAATPFLTAAPPAVAPAPRAEPVKLIGRMPLDDGQPAKGGESALEQYIKFDDGAYAWSHAKEQKVDGATVHHLRLTSQRWRSDTEVDQPLWKHWVTVGIPDKIRHKMAILIIGGGRHRDEPPANIPGELLVLLRAAGAVVVYIDNVPNQPLKLEGDEKGRFEDNLLARTWTLAMRDDDASWIGRFPMVKSAVKALDASEAFLKETAAKENGPGPSIIPDGWFVVGASKRGWTTWLTAAVDSRVKAIAPMVIDMLNMQEHTPHHWRSYGFWAPALRDYENNGIPEKFGSPELAKVIAHEDPLAYISRVANIPKYIVNAGGDEFFPTDSLRHYESKIPGVWRARCVPNSGHSLRNTTVPFEILAFYQAVATGAQLPEVRWTCTPGETTDTLVVTTSVKPGAVKLWEVTNAAARDFRIDQTGQTWTDNILAPTNEGGTQYTATIRRPATGWKAYLMECTFPSASGGPASLVFTTRVFITPDTLPHELPQATK